VVNEFAQDAQILNVRSTELTDGDRSINQEKSERHLRFSLIQEPAIASRATAISPVACSPVFLFRSFGVFRGDLSSICPDVWSNPVRDWLKHAFAIDRSFSPTDEELQLAERLCREIVRRQLVLPALTVLETARPLNSLGAQAIHFLTPMLSTIFDPQQCRRMAEFLDRRGSIDWLCTRLEELQKQL